MRSSMKMVLLALVASIAACVVRPAGEFAASVPLVQFPTQAALDRLADAAGSVPSWPLPEDVVDLPGWELDQDPPDRVGVEAVPPPLPDAPAIADSPALAYSRAATCAAHEIARILAQHGARPSPRLSTVIEGRCGVAAANVTIVGQRATPGAPEAELVAALSQSVQSALPQLPRDRRVSLGLGVAHAPTGSAAVAVIAEHTVELTPFSAVPEADGVVVRGRVLAGGGVVEGLVTSGPHRVARCRSAAGVAPPAFVMRCPVLPADATAWLQIQIGRPGRLLGEHAATVLVQRSPDRTIELPASAGAAAGATPNAAEPAAVLDLVNAVRSAARIAPLHLSAPQSQETTRLLSPFFAAMFARDGGTLDTIALGLLAGHRVTEAPIRNADIVSVWLAPTRDVRDWLDWALMLPISRQPLLDPYASVLAYAQRVGPDARGGIAALATTYRIFSGRDAEIDTSRVLRRLVRARRALGRRTTRVTDLGALTDAADAIHEGRLTPAQAVQEAAENVSSALGSSVMVHSVEAVDLDRFPWPPALLASRHLYAGIAMTFHRAPGAAWGQHVILVAELR